MRFVWGVVLALLLLPGPGAGGLPVGSLTGMTAPDPEPALSPRTGSGGDPREGLVFGALRFYKSAESNRQGYELLIKALRARGINVYPKVVLGSYLDLVDWIARGRIDLAWLPPLSWVSARKIQTGLTPLATVLRRGPNGQLVDHTKSLICARKGELPDDFAEAKDRRIVFGAELSTSGFLLPLYFFKERGIDVPQPYLYAGSQQQAVDMLLGTATTSPTADLIGVSELTLQTLPRDKVDRLSTTTVVERSGEPLKIANDAIIARAGLSPETCGRIHDALLTIGEGQPGLPPDLFKSDFGLVGFRDVDLTHYHTIEKILATGIMRGDRYSVRQAIDSMRWDIELETEMARLEKRVYKPKLALVFSGGGAAGSFQAGAAMEVAAALADAKMKPDIVVGTSVGAINGTAVAMGRPDVLDDFWGQVTMDRILAVRAEDRPLGLWKMFLLKLAQRAPATLMAIVLLFLAYFQVLLFTWALRPLRLRWWTGLLVVLAVGGAALAIEGQVTSPMAVTVGALLVAHVLVLRARSNPPAARWRRFLRRVHAAALIVGLVLVPAQIHRAFGQREALFANDALYELLGKFFLNLRQRPLKNPETMRGEIAAASRELLYGGLPHTLVISTTDFQRQTGRTFYVTRDPEIERRARDHGYTSIPDECPDGLIDLVVASAAVFPVLEPVGVSLKSGEKLRLIDGGFVHNNPVQVAVDLGATHVLILKPALEQEFIEADPSLVSSLFSFFGWLIARSQTEDLRAKDEVMSFLISPAYEAGAPTIGPLEFDGHYRDPWGTESTPQFTLSAYLESGRAAARSSDRGFQLWSRGAFKLPPVQ